MKKFFLFIFCACLSNNAFAIKKCQDSEGKWHYGDIAERACQNSKITTLNRSGVIKDEQEAPKSAEERKAQEQAQAEKIAEKQRLKEQELERYRILSIYETEADIDRQRDNQLYSVQSNIDVHDSYLKTMGTRISRQQVKLEQTVPKNKKAKIAKHIENFKASVKAYTEQLVMLQQQKKDIVVKFEKEKELYRELRGSGDSQ
ncbi:MAG: hypothetical protein ACI9FR_001145 [Cryomorphaceae bacterium]|jgi:hypothetical protein